MVSECPGRSYAAAEMNGGGSRGETSPEQAGAPVNSLIPPISSIPPQQNLNVDDFQNPFYFHSTENPNAILVSPPLTESNYGSWSRAMQIVLEVKNKFGFIDGSVIIPVEGDPLFPYWRRCNLIICSWLFKSLSPTIAESVLYHDNARRVWIDLKNSYSQTDPYRVVELQNQIYNMKQFTMSVNEYFAKSKALWEQMAVLRPLPICECVPRCSCTLVNKIRKEREDDQVIRFLEGLGDEYETVKSNVLVSYPIPILDKVFKMALKLERKINASNSHNSNEIMQMSAALGSQNVNDNEKCCCRIAAKALIAAAGKITISRKDLMGKMFLNAPFVECWDIQLKNAIRNTDTLQDGWKITKTRENRFKILNKEHDPLSIKLGIVVCPLSSSRNWFHFFKINLDRDHLLLLAQPMDSNLTSKMIQVSPLNAGAEWDEDWFC